MKLFVGLGNFGEKYENTRHNLGFMVVEQFLKDFEPVENTKWTGSNKFKSDIAEIEWQPKKGEMEKVILAKPKTFMNDSGIAVSAISKFYKIDASDIFIIHDDIDFQIGNLKIRFGGGDGGHNGIKSVTEHLGTDRYWRLRMGIEVGENTPAQNFVLQIFTAEERWEVKKSIKKASDALQEVLENGTEVAMNKFNTR